MRNIRMLAKRQPSRRRDLLRQYPSGDDYGSVARPDTRCAEAPRNTRAKGDRPGTRKGVMRQTGSGWAHPKKSGEAAGDLEREMGAVRGPAPASDRGNEGGFRVLVTRGRDQNAENAYAAGSEVTLANYKFNSSTNLCAYTTSTGFYARERSTVYPERPNKHMSMSPARDIGVKEQQAFTNLKAFLDSGSKEGYLARLKRTYRAAHLPPLASNDGQLRIRCDANVVREDINEETEEDMQ